MAGISGGSMFSARNLYAFVRDIKLPNANQLREPVTFYRSHRLPTRGANGLFTDGMEADVTPYHNAFAMVWQSQQSALAGENVINTISHVFIVRNYDSFAPEVRDGIVWEGRIHMLRGTRNVKNDVLNRFLIILAEQEGLYVEEPRVNTLTTSDALAQYQTIADPRNPLWK